MDCFSCLGQRDLQDKPLQSVHEYAKFSSIELVTTYILLKKRYSF